MFHTDNNPSQGHFHILSFSYPNNTVQITNLSSKPCDFNIFIFLMKWRSEIDVHDLFMLRQEA